MRQAIIKNGVVVNIIEVDAILDNMVAAEETTYIGDVYQNGVFTREALSPRVSTSLQFMDRFTEAEQLAIVSATMVVPQVKLWYDRMIAATEIAYKDPRTLAGLQALVAGGLLTAERIDEILPVEWR